jgi:hypothetical protein
MAEDQCRYGGSATTPLPGLIRRDEIDAALHGASAAEVVEWGVRWSDDPDRTDEWCPSRGYAELWMRSRIGAPDTLVRRTVTPWVPAGTHPPCPKCGASGTDLCKRKKRIGRDHKARVRAER